MRNIRLLMSLLIICLQQNLYANPPGDKDVTVTLFQWNYNSVAAECTSALGPLGYGYVEVSPPQEHVQGYEWWNNYQPVSYKLAGHLGNDSDFTAMVQACHKAGVKVIVDVVINHMTKGSGIGTGGTIYQKYDYPGFYQIQDFHWCRHPIYTYTNRDEVQNCELDDLADLDTGSEYVRAIIADYLNMLISLGADGFRIDAAKHIAKDDLKAIKNKLSDSNKFWVQEVIYGEGEAVQPEEYLELGDIDEFRYGRDLKLVFEREKLTYLVNFGEYWGYLPSSKARTFVDNWDTERNGSTLSYKSGALYTLANVFMLAHPYGSPNVYSGYEFYDNNVGAPNNGIVYECYKDSWKCQHRWLQIANMVAFRNAVKGTPITNWWSNNNQMIAFGRGNKGYLAINHENYPIYFTFQTSLPAGIYCDVQHAYFDGAGRCNGPNYRVDKNGKFSAIILPNEAVALYVSPATAKRVE